MRLCAALVGQRSCRLLARASFLASFGWQTTERAEARKAKAGRARHVFRLL